MPARFSKGTSQPRLVPVPVTHPAHAASTRFVSSPLYNQVVFHIGDKSLLTDAVSCVSCWRIKCCSGISCRRSAQTRISRATHPLDGRTMFLCCKSLRTRSNRQRPAARSAGMPGGVVRCLGLRTADAPLRWHRSLHFWQGARRQSPLVCPKKHQQK